MTAVRTHRLRPAPAALLAVVPALLVGLVWMHGLATHGTSHPTGAPDHSGSHQTMSHGETSAADGSGRADGSGPGPAGAGADVGKTPAMPPDSPGGGVMLGMCLALLTGLLAAITLLGCRRLGPYQGRAQFDRLRAHVAARGRDLDPPSLSVLCILRC